jgi:hypothetical protein
VEVAKVLVAGRSTVAKLGAKAPVLLQSHVTYSLLTSTTAQLLGLHVPLPWSKLMQAAVKADTGHWPEKEPPAWAALQVTV